VVHCERNMRPTSKKIDEQKAAELRTRWLAQKLRMLGKIEVTYEEFESEDGRIEELFSPLVKMAELFADNSTIEQIVEYGRSIEAEIASMETDTIEADLVAVISELIENSYDTPEVILVADIVEKLNNGDPKGEWTPHKVGRRLTTLGFKKVRLHGGKRGYKVDLNLLDRLKARYRIEPQLSLEASA